MLEQKEVPTRLPKEYLFKYMNRDVPLSSPDKLKKKHSPHFSNVLCKFFLKNTCVRGDDCIFSHDASQFPCNSHSAGRACTKPGCPFNHDIECEKDIIPAGLSDVSEDRKTFVSPFL